MFKCFLYSTSIGAFSLNSDKIGEVLVEEVGDGYVEAISKRKLNSFIKADKENLYFPQPVDTTSIQDDISKYGFALYIRDDEEKSKENIFEILNFYTENPGSYIFNIKTMEMHEKDILEKANVLLKKRIHIDTIIDENGVL